MPVRSVKSPAKCFFLASGADMAPPEWRTRPPRPSDRERWWGLLAVAMYRAKIREWAAGLDAFGIPLIPVVIPRSGRSDWHGRLYKRGHGPPLLPFRFVSRGFNLLRCAWNGNRAIVYWLAMRGRVEGGERDKPHKGRRKDHPSWTEILYWNATHPTRPRDVIGISPQAQLQALAEAVRKYRRGARPKIPNYAKSSDLYSAYRRRKPVPAMRNAPFVSFGRGPQRQPSNAAELAEMQSAGTLGMPSRRAAVAAGLPPWLLFAPRIDAELWHLDGRWLVTRGGWAWEVFGDGSTDMGLVANYFDGQQWAQIRPDDENVPERVRRVFFLVSAGREVAA